MHSPYTLKASTLLYSCPHIPLLCSCIHVPIPIYAYIHSTELGRPCRVSVAARLLRSICYNNKDALMAGLIIGR